MYSINELEKFRMALEHAPVSVLIMDKDWNFEYINPEFEKMSGYTREELLHKNIRDTLYRNIDGVPASRSKVAATLLEGRSWKGELQTISKDGRIYSAETTASPYSNNNGEIEGYIIIQNDVTEARKMQRMVEEREVLYRTLIEKTQDGVVLTHNRRFFLVNDAFCRIFGYTRNEIMEMDPVELLSPEHRERVLEIHDKRMMGEMDDTVSYMATFIHKTGRRLTIEINSATVELEGKKISFVTLRDITNRIRLQEALEQSEKKYRNLIEKATDGIVITQDGKLKFVNQAMCDMMQYTAEEMTERTFFDFVPEDDHEEMRQYHIRRMRGEIFSALYRSHIIRKDGKLITVELNARTLDYEGHPAAFIVIRDISERLKTEDELKHAKDELERLNHNLEGRVRESSESLAQARTQLIRLQKENLQSQFEVLRQQVNPHFLFNSLNVLTSLIRLDPELAEKFTEHLSKVYRYVLENKDNDMVDLKTELDFLEAYLFLLNIRFMDKLEVTIDIAPDKTDFMILPLALQLLIENAIKHNSMSKKKPLLINVFIDEDKYLNVVNNLQERESYITSTGVGLKNIEHRYRLLEMPEPVFSKTETNFIARIPLRETQKQ